ncbi:di-heme oxidoredictase family protein [Massilia niastensis]|uniref:di-heme oxidoredictase family protein n=1 Tax=Massilia niastensis TaxID=544911 RepID=UPI000360C130|nr:di-heme oxidoredictase family protein [Massilia niastensis]
MSAVESTARSMMRGLADVFAAETALTPVSAVASSAERDDLGAAKAIDGDQGSRWSSQFTENEHLTLDFGKSELITRVQIQWENAHATDYDLQYSEDGIEWKTAKQVRNSAGGTEDITGISVQGRYLRMQGIKRSGAYGYSIFEIQAFTGSPTTPPDEEPGEDPDPDPNPPPPYDPTKPGVVVKPVTASSSAVENAGLSALNAIDGKTSTRWASIPENNAWIQFDFGAKTAIGYMKLQWENAYGKHFILQVSDDGKEWKELRTQSSSKGGIEEFFNLNAYGRYIRLQGVQRATAYGYSLFEVEFKSPGSDNTQPESPTSALQFPASGSGMVPLPGSAQPIETLQFSLPDGTLVTRYGTRAQGRHARERGEDWNEPGYGANETYDLATGLPVDKGPGNYLTFIPQYFKNRTWGIEIIDNSRVAGVTKPTLIYNQYHRVDFLPGQVKFFRAFDDVGVTGFGWMVPGELVDDKIALCAPMPYPAAGQLASPQGINSGCTQRIKEYPGHRGLNVDGYNNGTNVAARALRVGDYVELGPSMFGTRAGMDAVGDNGDFRYYSQEMLYVVGEGLKPWYGVKPRLYSVPLPAHTLSGGIGSVGYDYADNGEWMFQQPFNNIGMQNMQRFVEGRRLIHTNFTTGMHNEPGNDKYLPGVNLQGQRFNQSACIGCHVNNGRSPALALNQRLDAMTVRTAVTNDSGEQVPHPRYGTAVQMNAYSSTGAPQDWGNNVRVASFETRTVTLPGEAPIELRKPKLAFEGPRPEIISLRAAQPMIGTGLLEAVPEADILARVRTAPDADGVKGVANFVFDPESGAVRLGRFGWKASKASLRHQSAAALLQDMAVTSPVYPNRSCHTDPANCKQNGVERGVTEAELTSIAQYLALVAVPAQRSVATEWAKEVAPLEDLVVNPQQVIDGSKLFADLRCVACHTAEMKTGSNHLFAELRDQTIRPYTDLLLHDMGEGLADSFVEGQAKGNMWRTAPLWGIGYTEKVSGKKGGAGYLHDGRARTLTEAILWHGGEAERSRERFENLSKPERDKLLAFLKSL